MIENIYFCIKNVILFIKIQFITKILYFNYKIKQLKQIKCKYFNFYGFLLYFLLKNN